MTTALTLPSERAVEGLPAIVERAGPTAVERVVESGVVSPLQPTASDAFRTSVTSMWAGVWVIAMGGRAERTAT